MDGLRASLGLGIGQNAISPTGAALGAAGGHGLGGLLGLLDQPRQAVASGIQALRGEQGGSLLPALLGAGAGGLAALSGVGLPFAAPLGAMAAGLAQGGLNAYDPEAYRGFSTEDVTGSDSTALNTLAGMLMDPMTYAGGLAGAQPGRLAGVGRDAARGLEALNPVRSAVTDERLVRQLAGATQPGMAVPEMLASAGQRAAGANPILSELNAQSMASQYAPEVLEALPGLEGLSRAGRSYKRINPEAGMALDQLGLRQGQTLPAGMPPWAEVRGGSVVPVRGVDPSALPGIDQAMRLPPGILDLLGAGGGAGHDARMRMLQRLQGM